MNEGRYRREGDRLILSTDPPGVSHTFVVLAARNGIATSVSIDGCLYRLKS